ncbi:MAG: phage baseplate assembly protein V [Sphingomonadales bacterium]|nr:MAG: phage baseplate assembly protein V [Sphingomonadales bacterium]
MSEALNRLLAPLAGRVRLMIGRAVIAAVNDDPRVQEVQIDLLDGESSDGVEHFQSYGLTSHPPVGLEALVAFVGGLRSHGVVVAVGDRKFRMVGLQQGEVALYDDQGQSVHLKRDGIHITGKKLTFESEAEIDFIGTKVTITADEISLATDNLGLGNDATLEAARKTDAVSGGVISGGSSKVKIA